MHDFTDLVDFAYALYNVNNFKVDTVYVTDGKLRCSVEDNSFFPFSGKGAAVFFALDSVDSFDMLGEWSIS